MLTVASFQRSPHWPAVAKAHLHKQPRCLACSADAGTVPLNVHHKYPFHFVISLGRPDLELDERNLYTMCVDHSEEHHLLVGHLDSYESYNPELEKFLALCRGLTAAQIRGMREWVDAAGTRPKPIGLMSDADRVAMRQELDKYLPVIKLSSSSVSESIPVDPGSIVGDLDGVG